MHTTSDSQAAFIKAACVPVGADHTSGTLEAANAMLALNPALATASIYTAAILGDDETVKKMMARQPVLATEKGGPHHWDALTYLCFSKYLRLAPERNGGHLRCAELLLKNGADATTGWVDNNHRPEPDWEPVLYGAAGIAHNAPLTRLLLQYGADPNDGETTYHTPESYDNEAMKALVETGRLTAESMGTLLLRKADWHDYEGSRYLLEAGADPNIMTVWRRSPLQSAILRDNDLRHIVAMMEHGADPLLKNKEDGRSAVAMAAHRGRGDVLKLFGQWGTALELHGVDALVAACALNDPARVQNIISENPSLLNELLAQGGTLLAEFSGVGNADGVRLLLDTGVNIQASYAKGDGYFGIAHNSTALHVAAWRAQHSTLQLLLERGAAVNQRDGWGRTPLFLAVLACTDSYWSYRRSPASVKALLASGALTDGIRFPTGYDEIDTLLAPYYA